MARRLGRGSFGRGVSAVLLGLALVAPAVVTPSSALAAGRADAANGTTPSAADGRQDALPATTYHITGTVTDSHGNPLEGIWAKARDDTTHLWVQSAQSDADGNYSLAVSPGEYAIRFEDANDIWPSGWWAHGWQTNVVAPITVDTADVPNVDIAMPDGHQITGRVLYGGAGVGGIEVRAIYTDSEVATESTISRADGTFTLAVAAGTWDIEFADDSLVYALGYWDGSGLTVDRSAAADMTITTSGVGGVNVSLVPALAKPTSVTAIPQDGAVKVSWAAPVNDGGAAITGYTVSTLDNPDACETAALSCVVTDLTNGQTYSFSIDARNAAEQDSISDPSNSVTPAASVRPLAVSGLPSPEAAGTAQTVTVTALNPHGITSSAYRGTVHFTSSDPAAVLPADYTFTAGDAGVHAFSLGVTFWTAGVQSVTVTDVGTASTTGLQNGIVVSPPPATTLAVATVSPFVAGSAHSLTVTAKDALGRAVPGYLGTIHLTSSDPAAVLPADYTFTAADAGVHKFSTGFTLKTAGSRAVTATDKATASITGSRTVSVTVGPVKTLAVATVNPYVAGASHSLTITAKDAGGNTVTGYLGTIHLTSSDPAAVLPADYTFILADAGVHRFSTGFTLKTAGSRSVTATDTGTPSITGTQSGIVVTPAAAKTLTVVSVTPWVAGAAHTVTITAKDSYGNTATGYVGTIHLTSTDTQAVLPANYTFVSGDAGVHRLVVTLKTAGSRTVTATDTVTATIKGTSTAITVTPTVAKTFTLTGAVPWLAGASHSVTVTARDAYGNVATAYVGTVHLTSSDSAAVLPADYTFVVGDAGVHRLTVKLKTVGSQWVRATDTHTATITGSVTITVS